MLPLGEAACVSRYTTCPARGAMHKPFVHGSIYRLTKVPAIMSSHLFLCLLLHAQMPLGTPASAQSLSNAYESPHFSARSADRPCCHNVAGLAGELTESLRQLLEPTRARRLAGDFRTGKRLAMRKVVAYIASRFRRDKIWLRRTRPDQRQYQVCSLASIPFLFTPCSKGLHSVLEECESTWDMQSIGLLGSCGEWYVHCGISSEVIQRLGTPKLRQSSLSPRQLKLLDHIPPLPISPLHCQSSPPECCKGALGRW